MGKIRESPRSFEFGMGSVGRGRGHNGVWIAGNNLWLKFYNFFCKKESAGVGVKRGWIGGLVCICFKQVPMTQVCIHYIFQPLPRRETNKQPRKTDGPSRREFLPLLPISQRFPDCRANLSLCRLSTLLRKSAACTLTTGDTDWRDENKLLKVRDSSSVEITEYAGAWRQTAMQRSSQ